MHALICRAPDECGRKREGRKKRAERENDERIKKGKRTSQTPKKREERD
jgi:hypothetical protein